MFVKLNTLSQPILSTPGINRIAVGNWILISRKDSELSIQNSDGLQVNNFYLFLNIVFVCILKYFIANYNFNLWNKWIFISI